MLYFLIIVLLIALDLFTKYIIKSNMDINQSVPIIENIFHITYVRNYGAAFNIFEGKQTLIVMVSLIAIIIVLIYIFSKRKIQHWSLLLALSLVAGGGIGNLISRITLGYVVDFLDFRIWPVFNVADVSVCVGCGFLILYVLYFEPRIKKSDNHV
ncbi:MAG: signal peptidase II [Clostridiales bacterium]|nr:signal peptidase II [Clostridiales bacterium]